ncbi:non-homologous end-joining DNA ligase [Sporolactobacillus terrae]|uniref:ATP-dependent DNA ligase n=1 Tax=Sporolactobacillus terrae TaxID=269673 RepID=A0A410DA42_9BACL|nr:non-homologous end-joining DNA ligase [Sporolactobacillus terrae]QAA22963.1 ATP-dependent DNA ligase [Sporolactobacillus terrae]QAA25936.1 ATP-dependent DNA ligase [Sporolactobacillus terrae]UAK17810.1 non-homologous end-joining DNA ligase [Sporolactobacillus terrae]BBN99363.1 hypothetical protein St703_20680 [Sporolactobacillus terrae]
MKATISNDIRAFQITHPEKMIWQNPQVNKLQFLRYLNTVAPLMLPFLAKRRLTVIRFPHGVPGPSFFQKKCPEYAPDFVQTDEAEGSRYILCNTAKTLLWLGNQLAIEYHIPYQKAAVAHPEEIVFDLDPPERTAFPLAIRAALEMKQLFERLSLVSFPKLSGSRGIQIHLPIIGLSLNYQETRLFTAFIAEVLVGRFPELFTIERLKKNRRNRLYLDYVQHAEGKTIICPYSPRGKEGATVAVPLFWHEVDSALNMNAFTVAKVLERVNQGIDPMRHYFECRNHPLLAIIEQLKKLRKNGFNHS